MISKRKSDEINQAANLLDVARDICGIDMKKKGSSYQGTCPFCGEEKKFSITPAKEIYKCWGCDKGGKKSIQLVIDAKNVLFPEACKMVADKYNILLDDEKPKPVKRKTAAGSKAEEKQVPDQEKKPGHARKAEHKESFRNDQLKASGITDEWQKTEIEIGESTKKTIDRYVAATVNERWELMNGDDMVMHYVDLYGKPVTYIPKDRSKPVNLVRVRWQNPALHLDKSGRPMKYKSPYNSGTHIWIPNTVRSKFANKTQFDTLYIQEGEKKADCATMNGMISVGIMGIHNIASKQVLPHEFQLIIKACGVKNVVFVMDSDCFDLGESQDKPIDWRPKSFYSAVRNYRDYFYAFNNVGIFLKIYFAHVTKNDFNAKGIDDLITALPEGEKTVVKDEFKKLLNEKAGKGKYFNCYSIADKTEYQILEIFGLHDRKIFFEKHKADLMQRPVFTMGSLQWRYNEEVKEFELAQALMPDQQFWKEEISEDKNGREQVKCKFFYQGAYKFFKSRQIGLYPMNGKNNIIRIENKIVKTVEPVDVQHFTIEFLEQTNNTEPLEMIYRAADRYIGPNALSRMKFLSPEFHKSGKTFQHVYFKNKFWKITAEGIEESDIKEMEGYVWENKLIDFEVSKLKKPLMEVARLDDEYISKLTEEEKKNAEQHKGMFLIKWTKEADECHFLKFLLNTCNFYHKQEHELTLEQQIEVNMHLVSKMCAIGYMLHRHRDTKCMRAVIAMDGRNGEVGSSNGRSGKSLIGEAIKKIVPTLYIPGKRKDLLEDKFLFDEVDERTCLIWFDDVRVNFDFEFLFPVITGSLKVERKNEGKETLSPENTPKIFIPTNHAMNGDGGSFRDRQWFLGFSDYYSENRRPIDEFGVSFWDEWNYDQFNSFYNMMGLCLQMWFKYGFVQAPVDMLEKRRLRQNIGEAFLDWAELYFSGTTNLNVRILRKEMIEKFYEDYPKQRTFCDTRDFKKKLIMYCNYKSLFLNPGKVNEHTGKQWGGDDKSGGMEYFTVADEKFLKEKLKEGNKPVEDLKF